MNTLASPWRGFFHFLFSLEYCVTLLRTRNGVPLTSSVMALKVSLSLVPPVAFIFLIRLLNSKVGVPLVAIFISSRYPFTVLSIHGEPLLPYLSSRLSLPLTLLLFHLPSLSLSPSLSVFRLCLSLIHILSVPLCRCSQNSCIEPFTLIHLGLQYWLDYYSASPLWENELIMCALRGRDCF